MAELTNMQGIPGESAGTAYQRGRQEGLAIGAFAMSILAFISLLGLEKATLAAVLGVIALRGLPAGTPGRRLGLAAIILALVYLVTFVVVMSVFHDRVAELIRLLQQLG